MRKASAKDIFRTVWKEKKRFIAIMMITFLGVTMMTGIEAGCRDLKISADKFYDSQELFDISIMSTLGLTEDDVLVIQNMEGIAKAEGTFTEIVHTKNGDVNRTAEVKNYRENGLNIPYVLEGRLPKTATEVAVSENYLKETGKSIGDSLLIEEIMDSDDEDIEESGEENGKTDSGEKSAEELKVETEGETAEESEDEVEISLGMDSDVELEEEETPNFPNTEFVIVGTLIDVMDINNAEGSASFRATPNADYTFFVTPDAVESEVYTAVYVSLEGCEDLLCYSEEYESKIEEITYRIESEIMEQREVARHQQITDEAYEKIAEKEQEMYDIFADIEQEFAEVKEEISDGWRELEDGKQELADGKQELIEAEQEAKQEIADAKEELADAQLKLDEAWAQLNDAEKQLNIGQAQLEEGKAELQQKEKEAKEQLAEVENTLKAKIAENESGLTQLNSNLEQMEVLFGDTWETDIEQLWNNYVSATTPVVARVISEQMSSDESMDQIDLQEAIRDAISDAATGDPSGYGVLIYTLKTAIANALLGIQSVISSSGSTDHPILALETDDLMELATGIATCNATELVLTGAMEEFETQKADALAQIEAGWQKIRQSEKELEDGRAQLTEGREEVIENYQKWRDGVKELEESEQEALLEIADAWKELAEGEQELIDGEKELRDGETELEEHQVEYLDKRAEAEGKIADAKQEVADIDMTKWYVQDRTSLSGYVNVDSDTSCIESLSTVFTIVFFVVAILISLTTVTRMVEEERGLIGTYKALGFTDGEIRRKYMVYALGASVFGAILGDVGGFVILPEILFVFFRVMYVLPAYILKFQLFKGTLAAMLFIIGIAGAAFVACESELQHMPAHLMRPKAPKEGSRVFLEYIKPLWKRMSFLNKVTARNLFRYKKRMIMTVFGIMGCTALLLFGLAIKDSVDALMPLQYEDVYSYDLLAATSADDNKKLISYMEDSEEITEYLNIQVESVKLKNEYKESEKVQLMIIPNNTDISEYVTLTNENMEPISIGENGIYLTENASRILDLEVGDTAYIQKLDLTQKEVQVTSLVKNYLGNSIYMSQSAYEEVFGEFEPNGILANLSDSCMDQIAFSEKLAEEDWILSSVSTEELKATFSQAFTLINLVVYVVLVLAACLAFVVLFTLASINISERERELATIKVLGFYDKEVHSYVNKETLILTGIGILIGLPVGALLSSTLTDLLDMPSIYFAITIYNRSYWITAAMALVFAFIVQFLTDRSLDVIDPVEALKSVE